jgi:hypothetical protein
MEETNPMNGKGPFTRDEAGNPTDIGLHSLEHDAEALELEKLEIIEAAVNKELQKRTGMAESNGHKFRNLYENLLK